MRSTADFKMFFLEGTELFFPDILFDTAFLINFICRPRMMTWLRENWRLYHIRCEIRSEINGIGNVGSYWVSSWDSWLLLGHLSWILRGFLVAKIVARYLIKKVSSPIPSAPTGKIYARFYATQHASLQLSRKIPSMDDRIRTFLIVPLL